MRTIPLRVALVAMACLVSTGCVSRRLVVNSNPVGAMVLVDGKEVGFTPCGVDFIYYGTREVKLIKEGYETLTVQQPVPTPWYQLPVIEFFTDNLFPGRINDRRFVSYEMRPRNSLADQNLRSRGEQLRTESHISP